MSVDPPPRPPERIELSLDTWNELEAAIPPMWRWTRTKLVDEGVPNIYLAGLTFTIKQEDLDELART